MARCDCCKNYGGVLEVGPCVEVRKQIKAIGFPDLGDIQTYGDTESDCPFYKELEFDDLTEDQQTNWEILDYYDRSENPTEFK